MSDEKLYKNKEWLHQKYIIEQKSISNISNISSIPTTTISRWLKVFDIKKRNLSESQLGDKIKYKTKEIMHQLYILDDMSVNDISLKLNISKQSILNWLNEFDIPIKRTRCDFKNKIDIDESILRTEYIEQKLSSRLIAKKHKVSQHFILRKLKLYNIPIRETKESLTGIQSKEKHSKWKGGITELHSLIRSSTKSFNWKMSVLKRDKYICIFCKKETHNLHVDHIKPFALIIEENNIKTLEEAENCEELWDINNGRALCEECHKKTDTWGIKTSNLLKGIKNE